MAAATLALGYLLVTAYAVAHWHGKAPSTARALCWLGLATTAIICATILATGGAQ